MARESKENELERGERGREMDIVRHIGGAEEGQRS